MHWRIIEQKTLQRTKFQIQGDPKELVYQRMVCLLQSQKQHSILIWAVRSAPWNLKFYPNTATNRLSQKQFTSQSFRFLVSKPAQWETEKKEREKKRGSEIPPACTMPWFGHSVWATMAHPPIPACRLFSESSWATNVKEFKKVTIFWDMSTII